MVIASSVLVALPPLLGLLWTIWEVIRAFDTVGLSGQSDPSMLSEDISSALVSTAVGLAIAILALPILFLSVVKHRSAKRATL